MIAARNVKVEKAPSDLIGRVKVLLQDYSADEIKAAVIKNWADSNDVPVQELSSGFVSNRYLSSFTQRSSSLLSLLGGRGDDFANLSQVEDAFEATFSEDHRREHGVVYTPPFIAKYLIREGMAMAAKSRKENFTFCDPCCGGAAFQIAAAEVLFEEQQINYEDSFQNHIWGRPGAGRVARGEGRKRP
jgi:hypothetical protein